MHPSTPKNSERSEALLQRSSLYQEFLAEREEILRHKWIESEKLGKDIGFERALLDWIRNHRDGWRTARRRKPGEVPTFVSKMTGQPPFGGS